MPSATESWSPRGGYMRTLNLVQFRKFADRQIEMANRMLAMHRPGSGYFCSCGKELPCSVAAHTIAIRDHFKRKLALLEATVVLPVLAPPAKVRPASLWRRLFGGWR